MFVCSSLSRPEINLQETIGTYKLSLMSRSLFATDGEMLHCLTKSTLMTFIEEGASAVDVLSDVRVRRKVVIVSGMAELQSLDKPAEHFTERFSRSTLKVMNYTWSLTDMTFLFP